MSNPGEKLSVGFLFDDTLDSSDGVSQQVKRLGEYLAHNGHKVVYLCGETKLKQYAGGKVYSLSKNIKIKFNGNWLSMPIWTSQRAIKRALDNENLDVIHVTVPYSPLLAQRVIAESSRMGIAVVGSFHILPAGWLSSFGARLLGRLQFFSLKRIQEFTSTSKAAAIFAKQTMQIDSLVVPNMVDLKQFVVADNVHSKPGRIVFLGRLVERKGCRQLIEAFSQVAGKLPDSELVIGGDGSERHSLERLTQKLGLSSRVHFLGYVDEFDKANLLASASVACFPALYGESFGVVLIEAMAAGSGVVLAGDNPGYRCVMEPQAELLVDARDRFEFSSRLLELLTNAKKRQKYHAWQTDHVKQYDVNAVGPQMLSVYAKAIAKYATTKDN